MDSVKDKIVIRCKKCNHRLFDYVSGDVNLEMMCPRCRRVMVMRNYTESILRTKARKGEYRI